MPRVPELFFDDVELPEGNLIGETTGLGFKQLMQGLHRERLAITMWYFDYDERQQARVADDHAAQEDLDELKAIEEEIAKFEARFGSSAERRGAEGGAS